MWILLDVNPIFITNINTKFKNNKNHFKSKAFSSTLLLLTRYFSTGMDSFCDYGQFLLYVTMFFVFCGCSQEFSGMYTMVAVGGCTFAEKGL